MSPLEPCLHEEEHGFATLPMSAACPQGLTPVATFAEDEGPSIIATVAELAQAGLVHQPGWARISLTLATALDGVGLTARIATALADAGISCNMVAAYHHDHCFVPWQRREDALSIIEKLELPR
ncbi:ACT domain-containing protein [Sphingomicrobium flavum]|uniref:ACT domain-containing protein n=1 Tax=Sphingomicrobium flavum TaxID=1229164 RepID=UPI0021AD6E5C|nr:ACT domain-containing protein [Sphingomicrobium flavum]